jgi:hypothetical protein
METVILSKPSVLVLPSSQSLNEKVVSNLATVCFQNIYLVQSLETV